MTIDEMMELLHIGRTMAYKLLNANLVHGFKIGKVWKIPRSEIWAYISSNCHN